MKLYAIYVTSDTLPIDTAIGWIGLTNENGILHYSPNNCPQFFYSKEQTERELNRIINSKDLLDEICTNWGNLRMAAGIFIPERFKKTVWKPSDPVDLTFQTMEFDFVSPLNVKTTVHEKVTLDKLFFKKQDLVAN